MYYMRFYNFYDSNFRAINLLNLAKFRILKTVPQYVNLFLIIVPQ